MTYKSLCRCLQSIICIMRYKTPEDIHSITLYATKSIRRLTEILTKKSSKKSVELLWIK